MSQEADVLCRCRCGVCCESMLVRASPADAVREPRIAERGRLAWSEGWQGFVLNSGTNHDGPCVFFERVATAEGGSEGFCTIHASRPDVCRLVDCDQLVALSVTHLEVWRAQLQEREGTDADARGVPEAGTVLQRPHDPGRSPPGTPAGPP